MSELDLSWIEKEERLLSNNSVIIKKTIPKLKLVYIYINENQYIESFKRDSYLFHTPTISVMTANDLLYLIDHHKIHTTTSKYKLFDLFLYHVDEQDIQTYLHSGASFFKPVVLTNPLVIPPCLSLFHSTTTLYFIYQEHPYVLHGPTKSILRQPEQVFQKSKRVHVNVPSNKTKKIIIKK